MPIFVFNEKIIGRFLRLRKHIEEEDRYQDVNELPVALSVESQIMMNPVVDSHSIILQYPQPFAPQYQ